jgi:AraC family transcriptional regulator of adaptative response/methylated-DNA-[protein]-cysteine methyltransferase
MLKAAEGIQGEGTAAARWARVMARDADADGAFVYAVRTTGVFCRPSCPSRPARPQNVVFFDAPALALAAGFRPCLRCRPLEAHRAGGETLRRMEALAGFIATHAEEPLPLSRLAAEARMSPSHLQRSFKAALGVSPKAFQAHVRLCAFKSSLRAGDSVLGAVFEAGYGSTRSVYEQVQGVLGMTPSAYRAGGAGEGIVFALADTRLGLLMMAATARGVCFVEFGEDPAALEARLRREFPKARLAPAGPEASRPLAAWARALDDHLAGGPQAPDLPLDLRGTAFQIRVWRFLQSLPRGARVSYGQLAAAVGTPRAVRAAASACAANRIAVLIPCHRAIRADGGLGGYRWGLDRKRAILEADQA